MKTIPVLSEARLEELLNKEAKLRSLENGGVDNWEFYDEALKEYRTYIEQKEFKKDFIQNLLETICPYMEEPAGRGCGYGIREEGHDELESFLKDYNITKL